MVARLRPAVVDTHLSTLFFYGDRVVKVRRPVVQGLADFRSLERRRLSCEREVALNQPLASDVYLGTATVTIDGGGPVEHAVVMRRLPKDRNLATMARRGATLEAEMKRLADVLARFHAQAERSERIDAAATGRALWQRWQGVEEALGRFVGPVVDAARYRELTALARRYLEGREALFHRRVTEGAVCDGHGSLEATDVFLLEDGPRILDRLELDEESRYGDVLADVGSLVQDLEMAGARGAADALVAAYRRRSGREAPPSLLHFYVAQRAHLRLLTQCLRQEEGVRPAAGRTVPTALLVDQALAHLRAGLPRLVLVGGLPASGKSTLAAWVAGQLEADVLATRQGHPSAAHPAAHPAGRPRSAYERLCEQAGALLATGRSVVLDAGWSAAADRGLAAEVARRTSAQLVALHCACPREERAARIARRSGGQGVAEAALGPEVVEDPWPEALGVDTSSSATGPAEGQPGTTVVPARPSRRSAARSSGPMAARPPVAST